MTVSATTRKAGPFTGNGSTATFAFSFAVFTTADIRVVHASTSGVEDDYALDTDYSVTLNSDQEGSPGGSITLIAGALASDESLTILGAVDSEQTLDIPQGTGFVPTTIEDQLDQQIMLLQQVDEKLSRALLFQPTQDAASSAASSASAFSASRILKLITEDGEVLYVPASLTSW